MSGRPPGTLTDRLLALIDRTGDCWPWTGSPTGGGYGAISISGRRWPAHRAVYNHFVDNIPDGHNIERTCTTPMCVRPEHLRAVPPTEKPQPQPPPDKRGPVGARLALADTAGGTPVERSPLVDWRHRAACRGEDPELFFPLGTGPDAQEQIDVAKKVCRGCPVAQECGTWAMKHGMSDGVWGGTSEADRATLRRRKYRRRSA